MTPSFPKNSHGPKLQVATFDKWNFPSERNHSTKKTHAFIDLPNDKPVPG